MRTSPPPIDTLTRWTHKNTHIFDDFILAVITTNMKYINHSIKT